MAPMRALINSYSSQHPQHASTGINSSAWKKERRKKLKRKKKRGEQKKRFLVSLVQLLADEDSLEYEISHFQLYLGFHFLNEPWKILQKISLHNALKHWVDRSNGSLRELKCNRNTNSGAGMILAYSRKIVNFLWRMTQTAIERTCRFWCFFFTFALLPLSSFLWEVCQPLPSTTSFW